MDVSAVRAAVEEEGVGMTGLQRLALWIVLVGVVIGLFATGMTAAYIWMDAGSLKTKFGGELQLAWCAFGVLVVAGGLMALFEVDE